MSDAHTDPEMEGRPRGLPGRPISESSWAEVADGDISMPSWAREAEPAQRLPSQLRYGPPASVAESRRPKRSTPPCYAPPGIGHSIGLGYVVLTLRELAGLSQDRLAHRSRTSQPGDRPPGVRTTGSQREHAHQARLGVRDAPRRGPSRPDVDVADLCMHDLTLLGVLRPAPDSLVDFFAIREPPPWAGGG
jgi:hypothetical protein